MQQLSQAYAPKDVPQAVHASTACIRAVGILVDWGDEGVLAGGGSFHGGTSKPDKIYCSTSGPHALACGAFLPCAYSTLHASAGW